MIESTSDAAAARERHQVLTRHGPPFAALIGLTALAVLLQGVFAGVFVEPGVHHGWLTDHDVNAYVTTALGAVSAVYAAIYLRAVARILVAGSVVLVLLLAALTAIGHAIVDSNDHGLTPVHVPLALLAFGLTIW